MGRGRSRVIRLSGSRLPTWKGHEGHWYARGGIFLHCVTCGWESTASRKKHEHQHVASFRRHADQYERLVAEGKIYSGRHRAGAVAGGTAEEATHTEEALRKVLAGGPTDEAVQQPGEPEARLRQRESLPGASSEGANQE